MNIKGGLFIAIGMLVLAIGDNYIRFITDKIGLWQFHFMRSLIAIPLLILFSFNQNYKIIFPKKFKLVFYRTALMVVSMLIYFGCLAFFPIAQVAAGLFTSPIFVIISVSRSGHAGWAGRSGDHSSDAQAHPKSKKCLSFITV